MASKQLFHSFLSFSFSMNLKKTGEDRNETSQYNYTSLGEEKMSKVLKGLNLKIWKAGKKGIIESAYTNSVKNTS